MGKGCLLSSRGNEINATQVEFKAGKQAGLFVLCCSVASCVGSVYRIICEIAQKSKCFPAKSVFPFPISRTVQSLIKPGSPPLVVHLVEVRGGGGSRCPIYLYPKRNCPDFLAPPKKGEFGWGDFVPSVHRPFKFQHVMCSKMTRRDERQREGRAYLIC